MCLHPVGCTARQFVTATNTVHVQDADIFAPAIARFKCLPCSTAFTSRHNSSVSWLIKMLSRCTNAELHDIRALHHYQHVPGSLQGTLREPLGAPGRILPGPATAAAVQQRMSMLGRTPWFEPHFDIMRILTHHKCNNSTSSACCRVYLVSALD